MRHVFPAWMSLNPVMKRVWLLLTLSLTLIAAFTLAAPSARAQDQDSSASAQKLPSPDDIVDMMGTKLNLTDDQKAQIMPVIGERRQKLQDLRSDTSLRPFQKKRKMKSIFDDSDKKIKAVLNDDQKKQYAQIEQQMREQMKERMQNRRSSN
jgi:periplasmic protein CpxP/Spy